MLYQIEEWKTVREKLTKMHDQDKGRGTLGRHCGSTLKHINEKVLIG